MKSLRALALLLVVGFLVPAPADANKRDRGPFEYLAPLPGAEWVSPGAKLVFRPAGALRQLSVVGTVSGTHAGRRVTASDGETVIFEPEGDFVPGERVDVSAGPGRSFRYSFSVAPRATPQTARPLCECVIGPAGFPRKQDWPDEPVRASQMTGAGYELPDAFPGIAVVVNDNPSPGRVFLANFLFGTSPPEYTSYLMILESTGEPVFFRPVEERAMDFKMQPDGRLSYFDYADNAYHLMDDTYTVVDTARCQGHSSTDLHDLQVLPNGNYLLIGYDYIPCDMSEVVEGGDPDAVIVDMIIQEIDRDDNVILEWRSWDHYTVFDAVGVDLTDDEIDFVHTNSVGLDNDGNILMSHRHLDEVTKVDRNTAEIIWQMGGKNNDFTLVGDDQWFSHQHSARRQPGGTLTLFDNGNSHDPRESRAIEYEVDEVNMTATRVWEYRNDRLRFGFAMGNVQRLHNGNTLVNWGSTNPNVTEVGVDGTKVFEMTLPSGNYTYRAFRFAWSGVAARPDLWATMHDDVLALNFTRFGVDDVTGYNIYRGNAPGPAEVARTVEGNRAVVHGFEAGQTLYFRVTALDGRGNESPFSNEISVTPDFSDRLVGASLRVTPRTLNRTSSGKWVMARVEFADAAPGSVDGVRLNDTVVPDHVRVDRDGQGIAGLDIRFPRGELAALLEPGEAVAVTVSGMVGERAFAATDAIRVLDPGAASAGPGAGDGEVATGFRSIRPNPFNPTTTIHYRSAGGHVTVDVFDVTGRRVRTLVDGTVAAGNASVAWDGRDGDGRSLSSGVYFCRLRTGDVSGTRKMLLMK